MRFYTSVHIVIKRFLGVIANISVCLNLKLYIRGLLRNIMIWKLHFNFLQSRFQIIIITWNIFKDNIHQVSNFIEKFNFSKRDSDNIINTGFTFGIEIVILLFARSSEFTTTQPAIASPKF